MVLLWKKSGCAPGKRIDDFRLKDQARTSYGKRDMDFPKAWKGYGLEWLVRQSNREGASITSYSKSQLKLQSSKFKEQNSGLIFC
jgi:hypothetical protein